MNPLYYIICGLSIFFILFLILYLKQKNKNKKILSNLDEKYNTLKQQKEEEYKELQDRREKEIEERYNELGKKLNEDYTQRLIEINNFLVNESEKANISKQQQLEAITQEILQRKQEKEKILSQQIEAERIRSQAKLQQELEVAKEWFNEEIQKLQESRQQYENETSEAAQEYVETLEVLEDYKKRRDIINEINRREEELQNEIDSHRIILTDIEKEDINFLLSIEDKINNKELLHKLIWSEYLQKKFNQMINNIFGAKIPKNVIYCIENYLNHKKYIGKTSTEVSKRWSEHFKTSLNIGGIKRQKIHDNLFKHWDNFTFSIIEVVNENNSLSEREKYWISFYQTDKFGYNIKGGG